MSRAPTAGRAPDPAPPPPPVEVATAPRTVPEWFDIEDDCPRQIVLLTTTDPETDQAGVPAKWHVRRQYIAGRWHKVATWVHPMSLVALDPQPTHWRRDPADGSLKVPVA